MNFPLFVFLLGDFRELELSSSRFPQDLKANLAHCQGKQGKGHRCRRASIPRWIIIVSLESFAPFRLFCYVYKSHQ